MAIDTKKSMKILIVDDDLTSRLLLEEFLKKFGDIQSVVNGREAVENVRLALESNAPYHLICLDIMMPGMDGHSALKRIRALEEAKGIFSDQGTKIIMTTSLGDMKNAMTAFKGLCDAYLVKPVEAAKLQETLRQLKLIS